MNYGLDIGNKKDLVGICYSTWFNPIVKYGGEKPKNIAEILAGKDTWGEVGQFHFWSEPALGYYRSDDQKIIRRHMEMLQAAGIDFIILDNTNASPGWDTGASGDYWDQMVRQPVEALLRTLLEMRKEGLQTPYVVSWNSRPIPHSAMRSATSCTGSISAGKNTRTFWYTGEISCLRLPRS